MKPFYYFSRLQQISIIGLEGGLKGSIKVFSGQGYHLFGNSRLLHSITLKAYSDMHATIRPCTALAARSDLPVANQRKNMSVLAAVSRTLEMPASSVPSLVGCGYNKQKSCMATIRSRFGSRNSCVENTNRSFRDLLNSSSSGRFDCSVKVSMGLRNGGKPVNLSRTQAMFDSNSFSESGFRGFTSSASTAPDVSFDSSACEDGLANSTVTSMQKIPENSALQLLSGVCYLPHPEKVKTGGEDAHFICEGEQAIGVADGVGGWADLGIDSGLYSRELMSNSVSAIHEEPKGSIDPAKVLQKAHSRTKSMGSSTACIIALTDQGLNAINLGDSGFIVVRGGSVIFKSPSQQHDFNFPYQLERGKDGDLPSSGQVFKVPVAAGDIIVAGTDGLFDNLYNNEIIGLIVHSTRTGLGAQVTAQKIASLALVRALDKNRHTPFSSAARDAGVRHSGGKLDDITVVVSYITTSSGKAKYITDLQ